MLIFLLANHLLNMNKFNGDVFLNGLDSWPAEISVLFSELYPVRRKPKPYTWNNCVRIISHIKNYFSIPKSAADKLKIPDENNSPPSGLQSRIRVSLF